MTGYPIFSAAARAASTVSTAVDSAMGILISIVRHCHFPLGYLTFKCTREQVTVFARFQCLDWCSQNFNSHSVQHAHFVQLNSYIQGSLSSESQKNSIGSICYQSMSFRLRTPFNDVGYILGGDRKIIYFIS